MGVSRRSYAAQRGVSEAAVRKAIATGRITTLEDGTIALVWTVTVLLQSFACNTHARSRRPDMASIYGDEFKRDAVSLFSRQCLAKTSGFG